MKKLRAASVQFEHTACDKAANLVTIERFVTAAAGEGVELICFPELCITGCWCLGELSREQFLDLAEPVPAGPASRRLSELAGQHHMTIGAGLIELADDGRMFNSYVVAMPDGRFACHRKIHMFISEHLSCGSEVTVFDAPGGWRVGVLTCYDNMVLENVRMAALAGADLLLAPHQTAGCRTVTPHGMELIDRALWDDREANREAIETELAGPKARGWLLRWLPGRAYDNGMFVLFSNGVGLDGDQANSGNAMILDPHGRILAETCKAADDRVIADLDGQLLAWSTGRRWMRTRRPELYGPLTVPTGAEVDTRRSLLGADGGLR